LRIRQTVGKLTRGNILVSNFNNSANLQGTTIVQISPTGAFSVFAQIDAGALPGPCPGGVGLTTALVVLRGGRVIVGSLPTSDGTAATAQSGCLLVLDSNGNVAETIANAQINGPWDMTVFDETGRKGVPNRATLFVNNVLNGTVAAGGNVVNQGTTLRIVLSIKSGAAPSVESMTVIGSGFSERTDAEERVSLKAVSNGGESWVWTNAGCGPTNLGASSKNRPREIVLDPKLADSETVDGLLSLGVPMTASAPAVGELTSLPDCRKQFISNHQPTEHDQSHAK